MINTHDRFYQRLESLTRKWWFYVIILLCGLIPPYTSLGVASFGEASTVVRYVADYIIEKRILLEPYMPLFHLAFLALFYLLLRYGNRFGRAFSIIAGLHYILIAYLQGGAITPVYGQVLYINVLVLFSLIIFGWFWEAKIRKTDYSLKPIGTKYYWMAGIVAVFSFWNPDTIGNLSPTFLITSTSPIAFCMTTPIYLVALSLLYPDINLPLFRVTSFVGVLVSISMVATGFLMDNRIEGLYWTFLHSPMLISTAYCFILGFKDRLELSPDGKAPST